jgi:NADPH:quinone reductase-like Zn-dependent oxidoreductase
MQAVTQQAYGPPDVLRLAEIDLPVVAADGVLVRVAAAGVNPGDSHRVRGVPYVARAMSYGLRKPKQPVVGTDVAGTVEAVGERVTEVQPGDEVFGWCEGAFGEYAAVSERRLALKPKQLAFDQAAAVPTAALAALQGLRDQGRVRSGQRVLVVGASGGVGTFAVQIAKALDAHVTAVCSGRNGDLARSIGADRVIDYTSESFAANGVRYDVILDMVGTEPLSACASALTRDGTYVVVGSPDAHSITGTGRFLKAFVRSPFTHGRRLRPLFSVPRAVDLEVVRELLSVGAVRPVIDRQYGLADAADAVRYVEAGHPRGKVVICV